MIDKLAQCHAIQIEFRFFDVHAVPKVSHAVITKVGTIGFRRGLQVSNNGCEHLRFGYEWTLKLYRARGQFGTAGVDPLPQYLDILGRKFGATLSFITTQRHNSGLQTPDEFGTCRIAGLNDLGRQQTRRIPKIKTVGIGAAVASGIAAVLLQNREGFRVQVGRGLAKAVELQ